MEKGCEAAAEIGMAIATPPTQSSFNSERKQGRIIRICREEARGKDALTVIHLQVDLVQLTISPSPFSAVQLVVEDEVQQQRQHYLLWGGVGKGGVNLEKSGHNKTVSSRKRAAALRTLLWFLVPKMMIMFYSSLLAIFSLDITKKDRVDLEFSRDDALMVVYTGFMYIGLRLGMTWRLDVRMQLLYHVYSAWVWGMVVFYFIVHPPFGLCPLATLVLTVTGSGLYSHVILLALCGKLDGRGRKIFVAGMFVPSVVLLASQPIYLLCAGPRNYDQVDYGEYMRNVIAGVIAAIAICYERLWHAHRQITSPMHLQFSAKLDQIFGSSQIHPPHKYSFSHPVF